MLLETDEELELTSGLKSSKISSVLVNAEIFHFEISGYVIREKHP